MIVVDFSGKICYYIQLTMNKILFIFFLLVIFSTRPVLAERVEGQAVPQYIEAKKLDPKAEILAQYLTKYNSPLQYHAQDFIDAAKQYNLDWRLVPAISGVESTFGQFIPGGYNGWGWGVYGNQAIYFSSWKEAIYTVSKGLKENYLDKGLADPYAMNRIYAVSPAWGGKVDYFIKDLEKFAAQFEKQDLAKIETNQPIAAVSASLAPVPYGTGPVLR